MKKPVILKESKWLVKKDLNDIYKLFLCLFIEFCLFPDWLIKGNLERLTCVIFNHYEIIPPSLTKFLKLIVILNLCKYAFQWNNIGPDHSVSRDLPEDMKSLSPLLVTDLDVQIAYLILATATPCSLGSTGFVLGLSLTLLGPLIPNPGSGYRDSLG